MEDAAFHLRYDCIYGLYIVRVASPSTKKGILLIFFGISFILFRD